MKKTDPKKASFWRETPLVGADEIFSELGVRQGSSLFLGRYSINEVIAVLAKKSFIKEARKRFLWPLDFDLNSSDYPLQRLQIYLREKSPDNLIVDFKFKETDFVPKPYPGMTAALPPQRSIAFEWLTLQNPLQKFTDGHTPLPGQTRPGLSMRKKIMDLFVYLGRLTRKDCLLAFPAYFHNAVLFSRYFHFWNPYKQAELITVRRLFSHMPFKQLAWVVHLNCMKRGDGTTFEWAAEEQLYPLTRGLKEYFDSRGYREIVKSGQRGLEFHVDWAEFEKRSVEIPTFCGVP